MFEIFQRLNSTLWSFIIIFIDLVVAICMFEELKSILEYNKYLNKHLIDYINT